MQSSIPFPTIPPLAAIAEPAPLNVVFAYENLSAAVWAGEIIDRLLQQIPGVKNLSPWSFSSLNDPRFHGPAMAAVIQADWIVVATSRGSRLLPKKVENWLKESLAQRGQDGAPATLVGAADLPSGTCSPAMEELQRLADEVGCGFFAHHPSDLALNVA